MELGQDDEKRATRHKNALLAEVLFHPAKYPGAQRQETDNGLILSFPENLRDRGILVPPKGTERRLLGEILDELVDLDQAAKETDPQSGKNRYVIKFQFRNKKD